MSTRRLMDELRRSLGGQAIPRPGSGRRPRSGFPAARQQEPALQGQRRPPAKGVELRPPLPVKDPSLLEQLKASTPAKVGVGRAGLRYQTETALQFLADFAVAQAAVESQVPGGWAEEQGWLPLQTEVTNLEQFLARPDLGRRLPAEALLAVQERCQQGPDVQIVVGDGLSAEAVMQNAPPMARALGRELEARGISVGTTVFVRHCRAKVVDVVGHAVGARVGIILLGERPGLGTGDGLSAYLVWEPHDGRIDAEKRCISNVHRRGLLPEAAGAHAANVIQAILAQQTSGVNLDLQGVEIPVMDRARQNPAHPDAGMGCGQSHGQQCEDSRVGLPGKVCDQSEERPCQTRTS